MSDKQPIVERLRRKARRASEIQRSMAEAKSLRQDSNTERRTDLYMWPTPEQTDEWEAADTITELLEALQWFAGLARYLPADMDDAEFCDQDEVALQAGHLRRAAAVVAKAGAA